MKILYIGEETTHNQYIKGNVPSHWFYGACEMEHDGHDVIWAQEKSNILNDLKLIYKHNPDIIFIPNLNIHNHLLLLSIARSIIRTPIYAYLHHEPKIKEGLKSKVYKYLLGGVKHLFFLSEKSMFATINAGLVEEKRCSVPGWGPDMDFYSNVEKSDNGWFVSTGKENRDFDILIDAFTKSGAPLHIITAYTHNGEDYSSLTDKCKNIPNIKVTIVDNTSANYPMMLHEMASAHAIVCPILPDRLNYCVGLSTIADAEGLEKPLIITANPYHNSYRVSLSGISVSCVEDWVMAIHNIRYREKQPTHYTMASAYSQMKTIMEL